MEAKRKESNVMTPVELFLSVVGVLANALALTPILMSVGFLVLLLWRQLTPLVAKASLGADPIGWAGVCRMLSTLCRTRGTSTKRRSCGGGRESAGWRRAKGGMT